MQANRQQCSESHNFTGRVEIGQVAYLVDMAKAAPADTEGIELVRRDFIATQTIVSSCTATIWFGPSLMGLDLGKEAQGFFLRTSNIRLRKAFNPL